MSISLLINLFFYSFLVNYLVHSLGFSNEEAVSIYSKLTSWKSSRKNPDLVINFFKQTSLDYTQIKKIVSSAPKLLFYDVPKILKPKFQCLMDLGLSGSDLVNVISKDTTIIDRGLDTHLRPTIHFLRRTFGSDENVVKSLKRFPWLLTFGSHHTMEINVLLLRNFGFTDDKIRKLVLMYPSYLTQTPERIKDLLHRVENDFGIPRDSPSFLHGFQMLSTRKKSTLDRKIGIFKSFGWSDDDILVMFRKRPYCIALSDIRIQKTLSLYMKEHRCEPAFLASRPDMLKYSLEKRVVPRIEVLKILDEKKVKRKKFGIHSAVSLSETKFIDYFVLPYKDQIPDLYEQLKRIVAQ